VTGAAWCMLAVTWGITGFFAVYLFLKILKNQKK
jgi:hypothetical protein